MNLPDFLEPSSDGVVRIRGHRIGIDDIVHSYNDGCSAEMLAAEFPTLSLALIHKVLAFYLENRSDVDQYVFAARRETDAARAAGSKGPNLAELRRRLDALSPTSPK
ncbi:MAG: DUF433 domain-containing protein [Planctomycetia bacterium]|nr:DUF433 domain-containing protein [Planctomycetia bacterium]